MRNVRAIARYEYSRHVRRRGFLVTALGIPLLIAAIVAIIVVVTSRSGAERSLGLVDRTGRFASVDVSRLDVDPPIPVERFADEAAAGRALEAGRIDAYVVIPADYLGSGVVTAFGRHSLSQHAEDEVRALLRQGLLAAARPADRARLAEPAQLVLRRPDGTREVRADNYLLFVLPYVFGLFFIATTFTTGGYLLQAVAEEKEDRVMEILATSISARQMMAGKVLGLGGVGLTQVLVWLGLGALAAAAFATDLPSFAELQLPWSLLLLALVYFLLGYLLIAACYATAGAMVPTPQEAQPVVAPVSMIAVAPLMLVTVILTRPDGMLAVIFSLIPLSAPMTMLMRLPLADIPAWQIAASLLILALSTAGAILLAARVLRIGMLRYGKRLSIREMLGEV